MTEALVCITEAGETYMVYVPDVEAATSDTYIGHVRDVLQYHHPDDCSPERITRIVVETMIWNDYDEQEVAHA